MDKQVEISRHIHDVILFQNIGNGLLNMPNPSRHNFILKNIFGVVTSPDLMGSYTLKDSVAQTESYSIQQSAKWTGEWIGAFYSAAIDTWAIMADVFGFG